MANALAYAGAVTVLVWGVAHAVPVKTVVKGFHLTSVDNRRILTMEWLAEALGLVFIGTLTILVTAFGQGSTVPLVQRTVAAALVAMAVLHSAMGARTSIRPMQICPVVLSIGAVLIFAATLV